jgi:SAM-dependent MidA family methyltransferase
MVRLGRCDSGAGPLEAIWREASLLISQGARLEALREHLAGLCRAHGPMSFARYMELCLYHPELGYYTAGPPPMGPGGDYLTYPSVHPAFGRLMGRQVAEIWKLMGEPPCFILVEMGGGRGDLSRHMLGLIQEEAPGLFQVLQLILVDRSPRLLEAQERALGGFQGVRFMDPGAFFSSPPMVGCMVSNELLDAMPVHLVEVHSGRLQEVFVEVSEGGVREVLAEPSDVRIEGYLRALGARLLEGQRVEVGLAATDWMERVGSVLGKGAVITVDFGYSGPDAFHPLRPAGTLMAYRGHAASPDPYALPGGQDLTAHVNFSALVWAGQRAGLSFTGLAPQDRFLLALGLLQEMEAHEARRREMNAAAFWAEKLALRCLMMPQPPQGGFQVLIQHKGWEPQGLRGLARRLGDQGY